MQTIEYALINGGSLKTVKRKRGIGKNEIYGLRDKEGNVITNMHRIVKVSEEFYEGLYISSNNWNVNDRGRRRDGLDILPATKEEVTKILAATQRRNAAVKDQLTADLLKDNREIVLENFAAPYTQPQDLEHRRILEEL